MSAAEGESARVVALIDDDESVRRSLARRLRVAGFDVESYASAQAFLDAGRMRQVSCIVTDLQMPGMSGLELQSSLVERGCDVPMVFISAHGDIPTSVAAMRAGAVHFLPKPFTDAQILSALTEAVKLGTDRAEQRAADDAIRRAYATLTPREREVFALVAQGLMNKLIADRLGAAEKTIKIHRGRVMDKLGASSVADLVRMASRLSR